MSVRVMTAVWGLDLPDSEKIVLLALADCANDEGHCWPGMRSLMKKCSKSERTIQGCIKSLCESGHLTRREVLGKGCNYTVHPRSGCAPADTAPPKGLRETPAAAAGKPSMNHSVAKATGAEAPDPVKGIFDLGVSLLVDGGTEPRQARSIVGKWRKEHGDELVMTAFVQCRTKGIAEPVEWLTKRFQAKAKYVSASGYEYRGGPEEVAREAERRADWDTYWRAKGDLSRAAA